MSTKKEERRQERKLKKTADDLSGTCPCCGARVNFCDEAQYVVKCHADFWTTHPVPFPMFTKMISKRWACDDCLRSKRAIKAYVYKQSVQYCHPEPFAAYFDKSRICRNCKESFVFSKEEQKHWYEDLQFKSWSQAVKCLSCRKSERYISTRNTALSKLIPAFEAGDHTVIEKIVRAYLELDNVEAAKRFLGNALRICKKDLKLVSLIKRLRSEIDSRSMTAPP